MQLVTRFNPALSTNDTFTVPQSAAYGAMVVFNESNISLELMFQNGNSDYLPAWCAQCYNGPFGSVTVTWQQSVVLTTNNNPASEVIVVVYDCKEPHLTQLTPLVRVTNIGNSSLPTAATSIQNDNNAYPTSIVEATPAGDTGPAVSLTNDAILILGDALHHGSFTLYGPLSVDNGHLTTDGNGNLTAVAGTFSGTLHGASETLSGTLSVASVTVSGNEQVGGNITTVGNLTVTGTLSTSGGNVTANAGGTLTAVSFVGAGGGGSTLVNTGNPAGTTMITSTVSGDAGHALTATNDGIVTVGDAAHKGSLTAYTINVTGGGTSPSLYNDGTGQLYIDANGTTKVLQVNSGGLDLTKGSTAKQITSGDVTTSATVYSGGGTSPRIYNDGGGNVNIDANGTTRVVQVNSGGMDLTQNHSSITARRFTLDTTAGASGQQFTLLAGSLSRISFFTGTGTSINVSHGLGATPTWVGITATGGQDTYYVFNMDSAHLSVSSATGQSWMGCAIHS